MKSRDSFNASKRVDNAWQRSTWHKAKFWCHRDILKTWSLRPSKWVGNRRTRSSDRLFRAIRGCLNLASASGLIVWEKTITMGVSLLASPRYLDIHFVRCMENQCIVTKNMRNSLHVPAPEKTRGIPINSSAFPVFIGFFRVRNINLNLSSRYYI